MSERSPFYDGVLPGRAASRAKGALTADPTFQTMQYSRHERIETKLHPLCTRYFLFPSAAIGMGACSAEIYCPTTIPVLHS